MSVLSSSGAFRGKAAETLVNNERSRNRVPLLGKNEPAGRVKPEIKRQACTRQALLLILGIFRSKYIARRQVITTIRTPN
jgi:hypothetical protein